MRDRWYWRLAEWCWEVECRGRDWWVNFQVRRAQRVGRRAERQWEQAHPAQVAWLKRMVWPYAD